MENITNKTIPAEKLVDNGGFADTGKLPAGGQTKKRAYRLHRIADPHIRPHKVKGRTFYYYCRGTDKEIYLGSADTILKAVKGAPRG